MCKPRISFFFTSIITILFSLFFPRVTIAEKPTLPFAIEARLLNNSTLEGLAKIKVTLTSHINIPMVSVHCDVPQGAENLYGKEKWEGNLVKDKPEEIYYSISVGADKYYQIRFAATMNLNKLKGTIYAFVEVNPLNKKNEAPKKKAKRLLDGKKVIEFNGE